MLNGEQLLKFARRYGTPLFVYDADLVRERYRDLYRFIPYPKLEIHYALKANYQIGYPPSLTWAQLHVEAGFSLPPFSVLICFTSWHQCFFPAP